MKHQSLYTEKILFNHYMVSGQDELTVHSQIPFYLSDTCFDNITYYGQEINKICIKILDELNTNHKALLNYMDDFPHKERIFSLKNKVSPMFWTRFDTFREEDDSIYFSEFNYDKPCGQKEMHLASTLSFEGNVNVDFFNKFKAGLLALCGNSNVNVGILMDPCHYEELHHAFYFKDIFKDTNVNIIQVGPKNLSVKDGKVYAFKSEPLQFIFRLFPTEFFYEIDNILEVLEVFENGGVTIINDPRILAIQCKGVFSYLWRLVTEDSHLLSDHEKKTIKNCLPYTTNFSKEYLPELIYNKDNLVIKSSLGRYSEEVYIGNLYSTDDWITKINEVMASPKLHIVQKLINTCEEFTYRPTKNNMNVPIIGYGNFGVYIMNEEAIGLLVRWSTDLLTNDDYTWMSPIGVKKSPIEFKNILLPDDERLKKINLINEECSFKFNFSGTHTNIDEYINLSPFIIPKILHDDLYDISKKFCEILNKTRFHILNNLELFSVYLGIKGDLVPYIKNNIDNFLCAIGRIDFVIDNEDNINILEFNSETPAGLVEAIQIMPLIKDTLNINLSTGNEILRDKIKENFINILNSFSEYAKIENIGILTCWYHEDIYTCQLLEEIFNELGDYNVILGNINDVTINGDKLSLYGTSLDCVYRHYPLDWFEQYDEMHPILKTLMEGKTKLINMPHTLVTQSKTYFSILHELIGTGFLTTSEEQFIKTYIPYTTLSPNPSLSDDCLIKPILSREGQGIKFSYEGIEKGIENIIFQERVNINPYRIKTYSSIGSNSRYVFPVIGIYISNTSPCGVFTRVGDMVTDFNAMFVPTFIN